MEANDLEQIERELYGQLLECRSNALERGLPFSERAMLRKFANKIPLSRECVILML